MAGWRETYERLSALDRVSALDPATLLELAMSALLIGKDAESFATLIRAHQAFAHDGDVRRAGGVAARLASIALSAGDAAQAAGWVARATRLLDDSGDAGVEHGHLLLAIARQSMMSGHAAEAEAKFAEAAAIGERFDDPDLTSLARLGRGRALIELGETSRGVALHDEAMIAVTAGEVSPVIAGIVYCGVLSACSDRLDLGRAREWTDAMTKWCDAQPDLVPYRGECLVHRAEISSLRGVWPDALHEALLACERLSEPPGQSAFGVALYQLGELHRLRGEFEEAEATYRKAAAAGRPPYPGLALLRLAQGRRDDASAAIGRVLQETRQRRTRFRMLGAAVEILLACGEGVAARRAADELDELARIFVTPFLRALAAQALGSVLFAEGHPAEALSALRAAWTLWRELEVPYEAARTQVVIAQACRALGDKDSANLELAGAYRILEQLGARPDLARVKGSPAARDRAAGLTDRELQVLRLIATGRTNRAIADALGLSDKTVARHISNIFGKLDVSTRAAATAYAFEHRLTEPST